ncbi:MAG: alpha/beta hydrolase, partial [Deltaproteobacteria bacterium]|nr:alpha/beta hydrolase [Deltaproteobacteria bacterium]
DRDAGDAGPGGTTVSITFEVEVPADTPAAAPVHIAGDFQGWDPTDAGYALTPDATGLYTITLSFERGQAIAFKLARGDWSLVEKGVAGEEIADRTYVASADATLRLVVLAWADSTFGSGTTTGNVRTVTVPGFADGRRVWVYLPPSYGTDTGARFPVLYMLDGQNVFDETTSFSGEWEVDESAERLIASAEIEPLIVVAVDNGGSARIDEYTPWVDPGYGGGDGDAHLGDIVSVLKPWVDARYRTRPEPESTGFSGSSLGGLMSVYTAYARSDVFGRIGALSPSIWWDDVHLVGYVDEQPMPAGVRLWVDMGTEESASAIPNLRALRTALLADGFVEGADLSVVEVVGGDHSEPAWARRYPDVLRFLFPAE